MTLPASARARFVEDPLFLYFLDEISALNKAVEERREENEYLNRQVDRLDQYTFELENRLAAMEALIGRMLQGDAHPIVEAHAHSMHMYSDHDMTDIDRLLAEYETEVDEDPFWFDDILRTERGE